MSTVARHIFITVGGPVGNPLTASLTDAIGVTDTLATELSGHGININQYDVLVRYNSYNSVDYSTNDGANWTTNVTPQAMVDALSTGTIFKLVPDNGTRFYGWHVTPKANMWFKAAGTIRLLGSRNLGTSGWTLSGGAWYKDVTFPKGDDYRNASNMDDEFNPDGLPERLWVDDETWRVHVTTTPATGEFRIQYNTPVAGTHRVWVGDDPSLATTIELASYGPANEWWAFGAGNNQGVLSSGVTLENLLIEKYPAPLFRSMIGGAASNFARDWTVRYCTLTRSSAAASQFASGCLMEHTEISYCGHIGRRADCDDGQVTHSTCTFRNNRIHHNGQIRSLNWTYEGGGQKLRHGKAGYLIENDWFHDNRGQGVWQDNDSNNEGGFICRSCLIENEWGHGIFDEISDCPSGQIRDIYWNTVNNCGQAPGITGDGGIGIVISNSRRTRVRDNAVTNTRTCIAIFADLRSPGAINDTIENNEMKGGSARPIIKIRRNNGDTKPTGEVINRNSYWNENGSSNWRSDPSSYTFAGWQGLGYDADGDASLITNPSLPVGSTPFEQKYYGVVVL